MPDPAAEKEFINICKRAGERVLAKLEPSVSTRLKLGNKSLQDKKPNVMLFGIQDLEKGKAFWHAQYTAYQFGCELSMGNEKIWHVRFLVHRDRKESGNNTYRRDLDRIFSKEGKFLQESKLQPMFSLESNDDVYNLTSSFREGGDYGVHELVVRMTPLIDKLHPVLLGMLGIRL